jgi:hypothetical protein
LDRVSSPRVLFIFFVVRSVEWTLILGSITIAIGAAMIADQRLDGRYERPRNHQQVAVEYPDQIEERIESRHDLAGLDSGYVCLRQAKAPPQPGLAPATLVALFNQFTAQGVRQAIQACRLDMRWHIEQARMTTPSD